MWQIDKMLDMLDDHPLTEDNGLWEAIDIVSCNYKCVRHFDFNKKWILQRKAYVPPEYKILCDSLIADLEQIKNEHERYLLRLNQEDVSFKIERQSKKKTRKFYTLKKDRTSKHTKHKGKFWRDIQMYI